MTRDRSSCDHIGRTKRGTPVIIDKIFTESDFRILTGLIEPHFMAGFSGEKSCMPGDKLYRYVQALPRTRDG